MTAIGIDYTPAYEQGGGIGRYVRELIASLAEIDTETDYRLFVMGAGQKPLPALPGQNFRWRPSSITPLWYARVWHRARMPIPIERWVGDVKLFHATDFVLPPTRRGTKTLLTVHDLSFVRVPDSASPRLKAYLDAVVPRSVRRADHILADSQATKDDLMALYNVPPDKVTVLLSGVNPRFNTSLVTGEQRQALRERYGIGDWPFIVAVGTVQPRKNYERLIWALHSLPPELSKTRLVIAGGKGWLDAPIYRTVRELKIEGRVVFTGFLDDDLLPALYKTSSGLAFPSIYEGFGLPILEAMACGVPVMTSNVSSMVEVAGQATMLVNPLSIDEIRQSLVAMLTDQALCKRLIEAGFQQASHFTWTRAATELRAIYQQLT
ncbi:MAG: glycosyltransferase family 4 protein [Anaerolineae bacterium]|nr:glycosyltransferase family 4 protein [Anaerolineae bacterium]